MRVHLPVVAPLVVAWCYAAPSYAQLDPLLFLKTTQPRILLAIDTSSRMQRDAPSDPAAGDSSGNYYDPVLYPRTGSAAESTLGITASNTAAFYRRRYDRLASASTVNPDAFTTSLIEATGDLAPGYALFEAPTRLSLVRAAAYQAIAMNQLDADFGLIKMRQSAPALATLGNSGPVVNTNSSQSVPGSTDAPGGVWTMSVSRVSSANAAADPASAVLVDATTASSNQDAQAILQRDARTPGGLLAAGVDLAGSIDAPLTYLLNDTRLEALRLIQSQPSLCANTIVVLLTGGGEGATASGPPDPSAAARSFLDVAGHRVPIHVVAIAPLVSDVGVLKAIAVSSGGQYTEVTKAQIDAALASPAAYPSPIAGTVVVPELVAAINLAVQHGFALASDIDTAPTASHPLGPLSEFQTASPIVATINLANAADIHGQPLADSIVTDAANAVIPQRSNTLIAAGFTLPGFDASLRAFRHYRPVVDASTLSGWRFESDRTPLWLASAPDSARRNLFTAAPDGTLMPFTDANATALAPLMNLGIVDARAVIAAVRAAPLGPIIDSTPAVMNAPSLDPPPDLGYAKFASDNKRRRDLVWVGTNAGILEAIDARLGVEVWGFIPLNLLPKLNALRLGQGLTQFRYFADGSPKIADVKIDGAWQTQLIASEGGGGTFYQAFDVTLAGMADVDHIAPDADDLDALLRYFSDPARITMRWSFPRYSSFDPALPRFDPSTRRLEPIGDVRASAPILEKTVGETWSAPAIGQIGDSSGPFAVIVGSGLLTHTTELQPNRAGVIAGTTMYVLSVKDGQVYASADVGSDGRAETIDDCTSSGGSGGAHLGKRVRTFACDFLKNALQGDPTAITSTARILTRAYAGDLDGRIWRFDLGLDAQHRPTLAARNIAASPSGTPVVSSIAAVQAPAGAYVFYATGSDLLPASTSPASSHAIGVFDQGGGASQTFAWPFGGGGRAAGAPVVAGDVVFFTASEVVANAQCADTAAQLVALTYAGGGAFDTNNDGRVDAADSPLVARVNAVRATAPFVADRHLVFGTGNAIAQIGDPAGFNNGVGRSRLRIVSWREVR